MTPELQKKYDALAMAARSSEDGRWDTELFIQLWNALPEGLRHYINFNLCEDNLLASTCREQFMKSHGRAPAALEYFDRWEEEIDRWPSAPDRDRKTRLVSHAEVAEKAAAVRKTMLRGVR